MRRLSQSLLLLTLAIAVVLTLEACTAETAGVKLTLKAEVVGSLTSGKAVTSFENRRGWKIQLEKAYMLVGPVYLLEGEPQAQLLPWFLPWRTAHAHVNANGQRVLAELREHFVLDLLKATPTSLGEMRGIAGTAQTAELHLLPPGGTRLAKTSATISNVSGATVFVQGKATLGKETRSFELKLTLPKSDNMRIVGNIGTDISLEKNTVGGGRLLLKVYVDRWFTNVDFATLTKKDESGRSLLTADDSAIQQGIRSRYSYHFAWSTK